MAFRRFISVVLAGLMVLSSINTGSMKVYASSDEQELVVAAEEQDVAADAEDSEVLEEEDITNDDVLRNLDANEDAQPEDSTEVEEEQQEEPGSEEPEVNEVDTTDTQVEDTVEIILDANGGWFDNNEGSVTFRVSKGTPLSEIQQEPVNDGFEFEGWFLDRELTLPADTNSFAFTENAVLYAKWQEIAISYEEDSAMKAMSTGLNLDANGGKFPNGSDTYFYEAYYPGDTDLDYDELRPTKEGAVFVGWYKESTCETRLSSDDDPYELKNGMSANDTIYAKYSTEFNTVTFVYGSGTAGDKGYYWDSTEKERVNSVSVKVLSGSKLSSATRTGYYTGYVSNSYIRHADAAYSFNNNWYTDIQRSEGEISSADIYAQNITEDVTIYAGYIEDNHVITFHSGAENAFFKESIYGLDEGTGKFSQMAYRTSITAYGDYSINTESIADENSLYNTDPRMGIEGFYLSSDYGEAGKLSPGSSGAITIPRDETDVWIKWANTKSTITFVANGGDEGYIWNKDPHTGESGRKAQVEFALEEGTLNYYYVGELKSNNPRWKFLGWSEDPEATQANEKYQYVGGNSNPYTVVKPALTENTTLYGVWDKNYYWVITFKAGSGYFELKGDDGEIERHNEYYKSIPALAEGASTGFTPEIPKHENSSLAFSQWSLSDGTKTNGGFVEVDRDNMIFTAEYDTVYKITLHADDDARTHGGYWEGDSHNKLSKKDIFATAKAGARVVNPETDKNYEFGGWFEDPECTIRASVDYSYYYPTKDIDLYARWLKKCTVTFDAGQEGTIDVSGQRTFEIVKVEGEKICEYSYNSLPVAVPNDENTIFVAWVIIQQDGSKVRFKNNEVKDYEVFDDVTFTATYNEAVDVTFVASGGFVNKDAAVTQQTVKIPKGEPIGTRVPAVRDIDSETSPKVFKGWFDKETDGKEITNLYNFKPETATTLYAGYADCNVVTFHANNTQANATIQGRGETLRVLVPKGKALEYFEEGSKYKTKAAPDIAYDSEYTDKVPLRNSGGSGNIGWATNATGTGDIYYLDDGWSCVVEDDGTEVSLGDSGFVPTGNIDFYVAWVPEVEVTFTLVASGGKGGTFDPERVQYADDWTLSSDKKSVTYKVPSGIRFGDIYGPGRSYIANPPENKECDWRYDSTGSKLIPSDKKITTKTTVKNKWVSYDSYDPGEPKTVALHAGKGYFGSKGYGYATENQSYFAGKSAWVAIPNIDDPDKAFIGYSKTAGGTTADFGTQKFDMGWAVTFPTEVQDLYAVYGPTATLTLEANGGFFSGSASSEPEYSEETRDNTSVKIKPSIATSAGATMSLQQYTDQLKHEGNKVFSGWTIDEEGTQKLPLSSTDMYRMVFAPAEPAPVTAYAQWEEVSDNDVPATLAINLKDQALKVGETKDFGATLSAKPEGFMNSHRVNWIAQIDDSDSDSYSSKSSSAVVSISDEGKLSAVGVGKVKVWAECNGRRSNAIKVTVTDGPIEKKIELDQSQVTIEVGDTASITAQVTPETEAGNVKWAISNKAIATIEGSGAYATITGAKAGTATVTASLGTKTAKLTVIVKAYEAPVSIKNYTVPVIVTGKTGNTRSFTAVLSTKYADSEVEWSISDNEVAKIQPLDEKGSEAELTVISDAVAEETVTVTAVVKGTEGVAPATAEVVIKPVQQAKEPDASPKASGESEMLEVKKGAIVELTTKETDAKIFYTTDGTDPTSESLEYKDAIKITEAIENAGKVTIKAITVKEGLKDSAVKTFVYTIKKDSWGDLANDPALLEKATEWWGNDSNNVPAGVWYAWKWSGDVRPLSDVDTPATVSKVYTAEKVTFNDEVVVYHHTRKLIENRDYTISYKNNINAADKDAAKAPTFTVKGKGTYNNTHNFAFEITQEDMATSQDLAVTSEKKVMVVAGKNVKLGNTKPVITYKGKKLALNKDYELSYFRVENETETRIEDPAKEILSEDKLTDGKPIYYRIKASGKGNYMGNLPTTVDVEVVRKDKNIVDVSKLKVVDVKGKAIAVDYTGAALPLETMFDNSTEQKKETATAFVKYGKVELTYGKDFTVKPADGYDLTSAGKQNIVIAGLDKTDEELAEEGAILYVGEKTATVTIKAKAAINKAKVAGLRTSVEYLGRNYTKDDLDSTKDGALFNPADRALDEGWNKVTLYTQSGKVKNALVEGEDYEIETFETGIVGKFTIIFTGKNGCTGTLKKTISIKAANLKGKELDINVAPVTFAKSGAKPKVTVSVVYNETYSVQLRQGIDYTVAYKNNAKVFDVAQADAKAMKTAPTVTVKGIGNYAGAGASKAFSISAGNPGQINVFVKDVVYNKNKTGKSGYFLAAPKLMDDGKALSTGKNKDVETINKKTIEYHYHVDTVLEDGTRKYASDIVGAKDKIPAGTVLEVHVPVTLSAASPYNGTGAAVETTLVGYYRVINSDIAKAKVTIKDANMLVVNNGEAIKLTKEDIEVKIGNGILNPEDYDIVSETNNTGIGTMTLTIAGKGSYGGTKIQTFKIKAKSMK